MNHDELAEALALVYRVETGLRLDLEGRAKLMDAIEAAWGASLEKMPKCMTDNDFQETLKSIRVPIAGKEYTGILRMLPRHAPELPRRLTPILSDTFTLDELPVTYGKATRDKLKQAQAAGLRLWVHLDASAELVGIDPLITTDPLEPRFNGQIDVDFAGLVALNPVYVQALLDRGWAGLQSTLGFAGGAVVYRGEPKIVTLEHVRILASDIQAQQQTEPPVESKKIPANQHHAAKIQIELKRRGISEPLPNQYGIGKRGLFSEMRHNDCLKRMGLTFDQLKEGWKLIKKTD